jgi:hypothetical protein
MGFMHKILIFLYLEGPCLLKPGTKRPDAS